MANSPQAKKRARQAEDNRQQNASQRSRFRTLIKNVRHAIGAGDKDAADKAFQACEPVLDRYASRGLIHKNFVARQKSRLRSAIKALG
ncbi:MAG: 30S ribosomal protein S20 [Oceanococcaceae bacterium]